MSILTHPGELTPFQRWVLLKFHQQQKTAFSVTDLITSCCVTAMDATFNKNTGLQDISQLEHADLIGLADRIDESAERDYGHFYLSTIDGIIYAKKMMKPILDAMNKDDWRGKAISGLQRCALHSRG